MNVCILVIEDLATERSLNKSACRFEYMMLRANQQLVGCVKFDDPGEGG